MILTKDTFINALQLIRQQDEIMDAVNDQLRKLGGITGFFNIDSLNLKALLNVLKEVLWDEGDWISWWLYEDVEKTIEWEENGQTIKVDVTEPGALWDFLRNDQKAKDLDCLSEHANNDGPGVQLLHAADFHLLYDACLEYINQTNHIMHLALDSNEFYVMSQQRYEELTQKSHD